MTIKEKLEEATVKALTKQEEASYSRIYQHTQDDSTFAIIGCQDKDTKEFRKRELYDLVRKFTYKVNSKIGYNMADDRYRYVDEKTGKEGEITFEDSLIIYNIDKKSALDIAKTLNQESIVWKDTDFFGILYTNGTIYVEFDNEPGQNMNFSGAEQLGYETKLKNDKRTNLGFTFEGSITYPKGSTHEEQLVEKFVFYSK